MALRRHAVAAGAGLNDRNPPFGNSDNFQRSDKKLSRVKISLFQFGEQGGAIRLGSRATHDGSAMQGLLLANRHRSIPIRAQVRGREGAWVLQMGVQSQNEGGAFLHEANTRMLSAVDAPRVSFGLAEPAFQVQIVLRQIKDLAAGKQARLETGHHPGHLGVDRILAPLQPLS